MYRIHAGVQAGIQHYQLVTLCLALMQSPVLLRRDVPKKYLLILEEHKGSPKTYCMPGVPDTLGCVRLLVLFFPFSDQGSGDSEQASQNKNSDVFTILYINTTKNNVTTSLFNSTDTP